MSAILDFINSAPDPRTGDYNLHVQEVRHFDSMLRQYAIDELDKNYFSERLRHLIDRMGGQGESALIGEVCVGSDGREEKGVSSPMDLVVYVINSGLPHHFCEPLGREVNKTFVQPEGQRIFEQVEVKFLESRVSLFNGGESDLWPERVLDANPLREENSDISQGARRKLLAEARNYDEGHFGARLNKRLSERITNYRRSTRAGSQQVRGETVEHFSLEKGEAYYDQSTNRTGVGQSSFKQNVLRLVQNILAREMLRYIREASEEDATQFILGLPTNTGERIHYMAKKGIFRSDKLDPVRIEQFIDNYHYFLWLYHQSEYVYLHFGSTVLSFDKMVVKNRRDDLLNLSERAVKS